MAPDTPYYICDGRVRFEVCAPIVGEDGEVQGIIDLEAWTPQALTQDGTLCSSMPPSQARYCQLGHATTLVSHES